MNPCIKTGLNFRVIETGESYTGDLFYHGEPPNGLFQIRGIPIPQQDPAVPIDVWVLNVILCQRADSPWQDTNSGISLVNPSFALKEHIKKYYPELIDIIPGVNDGQAA